MSSIAVTADAPTRGRGVAAVRALGFGFALLVGALVFGAIAGELGAIDHAPYVFGLSAVLLPVLVWKRPQLEPIVILAGAVLVDFAQSTSAQTTGPAAVAKIPITSHIPLFTGIGSFHIEPIDLVLLMVAIIYLLRTGPGTRFWPRTPVSRSLGALLGCVMIWIALGIVDHGTLQGRADGGQAIRLPRKRLLTDVRSGAESSGVTGSPPLGLRHHLRREGFADPLHLYAGPQRASSS